MEERNVKIRKIENVQKKSMPEQERCFSMGWETLSGLVAVNQCRFLADPNSAGEKREQRKE